MKYTIAKMFQILRHNRWVSILMIIEIALGMSVFTYSLTHDGRFTGIPAG